MSSAAMILQDFPAAYGYKLQDKYLSGKPHKDGGRLYKLYPIDDTPSFIDGVLGTHLGSIGGKDVTFCQASTVAPKFPSYTFTLDGVFHEVVICENNRGASFEDLVFDSLNSYVAVDGQYGDPIYPEIEDLIERMQESSCPYFHWSEVKGVSRGGSNIPKANLELGDLGKAMGDIVLHGHGDDRWFISLKGIDGGVISAKGDAVSLFDEEGTLIPNSRGSAFLMAYGADLGAVQAGFDLRNGISKDRPVYHVPPANSDIIKTHFQQAWGINYFYARKKMLGWLTFWLDHAKLESLTSNIVVERIVYPSRTNKSINIDVSNAEQRYIIEIRNSKGGEYPNDIKFKVRTK